MKKVLKYLMPILICAIATVLILVGRDAFVKSGQDLMKDLCDGFAVSGIVMLGFGVLVFATNGGTFDMLAYGAIRFFNLFKRDLTKVKYRTFYEYRQAQNEKKRSFLHLIIIGAGFLIVGVVFLIVYYQY